MTIDRIAYEVLDSPAEPHPESVPDAYAWGVKEVGLPGDLSVYGLGVTLEEALGDLLDGVKAARRALPM